MSTTRELHLLLLLFLPFTSAAPPPPSPATRFNRTFVREALDYAAASYADDPSGCLARRSATLMLQLALPCDAARDKCWAMIADAPDRLVVAFQGTNSRSQLITELLETITSPKHDIQNVGSVERYFFVALKSIAVPLAKMLNSLREKYPKKPLLFTGHSLGGALASLAATLYTEKYKVPDDMVSLVTFGQPRVGNLEYAQTVDRIIPDSWRIVHRYDMVAHIPFCPGLFNCVDVFNHSPHHHGTEVWFPGNMSMHDEYRICTGMPKDEDSSCSNAHYFKLNINDHLYYFDREVSWYGQEGCPDVPPPIPPPNSTSNSWTGSRSEYRDRNLRRLFSTLSSYKHGGTAGSRPEWVRS